MGWGMGRLKNLRDRWRGNWRPRVRDVRRGKSWKRDAALRQWGCHETGGKSPKSEGVLKERRCHERGRKMSWKRLQILKEWRSFDSLRTLFLLFKTKDWLFPGQHFYWMVFFQPHLPSYWNICSARTSWAHTTPSDKSCRARRCKDNSRSGLTILITTMLDLDWRYMTETLELTRIS